MVTATRELVPYRINTRQWNLLRAVTEDRVIADERARVWIVQESGRPLNATCAAKAMRDRGLVEDWRPAEQVFATAEGSDLVRRRFGR